jgi:3-oxoacyl-[acyl-carrier protein] reductase
VDGKLEGRKTLVTGGNRGIGRAIAVALARAGTDIIINFRSHEDEARAVESEIRALGRKCAVIQADVSRSADVDSLVTASEAQVGAVDILVNNAGIARPQPFEQISEKDWDELIDVNLKSCFLMTQRVLPRMRERKWGRIINMSSVAAATGGVVGPHYAASKAGMLGLTHFYSSRLAREGITVNAIAPALIETEMVRANQHASPDRIPMGRFGAVEEVAEVALMIVNTGYLTGQTIHLNGGWFMT